MNFLGAGGIGFDVAEFITHDTSHSVPTVESFAREWGIDISNNTRGKLVVVLSRGINLF